MTREQQLEQTSSKEVTFYFALTESAFISLSSLSSYSQWRTLPPFEMSENMSQVEKGNLQSPSPRLSKGSYILYCDRSLGFKLGTKQFLF